MPRLEFVCTYDYEASYRVVGGEHDGKRLEYYYLNGPALYDNNGHKRLNYTPGEYQLYVADVVGYLRWYNPTSTPPLEFARQFNEQMLREYEQVMEKYPDYQGGPPELLKGVAMLDYNPDTNECRGWIKTGLS